MTVASPADIILFPDSYQTVYTIRTESFEGPFDLLLHLIKKNEVDIYNIPIAAITRQYLDYLDVMQELNLDIAGDFLVMASTLIQIKSRMLLPLPPDEEIGEEEVEDPRAELVRRLLEYQKYKEAAVSLAQRELLGRDTFVRDFAAPELAEIEPEQERLVDVLDGLRLFGENCGEGLNPNRPAAELLDDRGQELSVRTVQACVVDLQGCESFVCRGRVDPAVAVDLGVVANAAQKAVYHARSPPAAPGDGRGSVRTQLHAKQPGGALHDRGEIREIVEVKAVRGSEPVSQRA